MKTNLLAFLGLTGRRLALLFAVFLAASAVLFAAVRAVPGDPVGLRVKNPDPVRVAEERARLGLDRPLPVQWWLYASGFVRGDWGRSLLSGRKVVDDVREFFPATLELSLAGLALGALFGVATAVGAEVLRWPILRHVAQLLGNIGLTVPVFWIGFLALVAGSWWLGWFPTGGRFDLAAVAPPVRTGFIVVDALLAGDGAGFVTALEHLALPVACLSLYPAAQVCAVLQARLRERRLQTLITSLRARGLGPARIWLGHVLRIVSAPVITAVGSNFGSLLGGAVLIETVFSWPGIGRYLAAAVIERDLYVVQNVLLLVILLAVLAILASDFVAWLVNPVARHETATTQGEDSR